MRLLRLIAAAAIVLFITTAQAPTGFPKNVNVPALVMTGMGAPAATTTPEFQPKTVSVTALQMTGVEAPTMKAAPFTPKEVRVPMLTMTGVH